MGVHQQLAAKQVAVAIGFVVGFLRLRVGIVQWLTQGQSLPVGASVHCVEVGN